MLARTFIERDDVSIVIAKACEAIQQKELAPHG